MRRNLIAIPALILALALGACTASGGGDKKGDQAGGGSSKNSTAFKADPPLAFNTVAAVKLPDTALRANLGGEVVSRFTTLRDRTAYIVEPALLRSVDLLTGKQKWQLPIAGAPADPNAQHGPFVNNVGPRPPLLSDDGKTVIVAVPVTEPGAGTTPSHQAISVLAANSDTGRPKWATKVAVSDAVSGGDGNGAITSVVAATDKAVIVTYRNDKATTAAINPSDQRILWQRDQYEAGTVTGDLVVGIDANVAENSSMVQATALDLVKGDQRWVGAARSSQVTIVPANSALVVVDRADYGSGDADLLFLDPKTGQQKASYFKDRAFGGGSTLGPCQYDQRSVVVCSPFEGVTAYDATSGKQLWQLPDKAANRVAPGVTAVWHGAVYGSTSNGPVILDALTGKDRSASPGAAPHWVSEYGGIGLDPQGAPIAYPARPSPSKTQ
ncbi:MAG TPA: PQQ-binding-like beta-propeller repeat protein [Mycobacteriales bacterium]|jgi:outer membrane protein assembly factor BamB|nr:PQQ-binding-like beta-propeller repeat protein [Mycobacteriales bacterium]